jgi:hypothetical protein
VYTLTLKIGIRNRYHPPQSRNVYVRKHIHIKSFQIEPLFSSSISSYSFCLCRVGAFTFFSFIKIYYSRFHFPMMYIYILFAVYHKNIYICWYQALFFAVWCRRRRLLLLFNAINSRNVFIIFSLSLSYPSRLTAAIAKAFHKSGIFNAFMPQLSDTVLKVVREKETRMKQEGK